MATRSKKRNLLLPIVFAFIILLLVFYTIHDMQQKEKLIYAESLEETVAEINGVSLSLKDLAFYVAYEEQEINKQAEVYDAQNPKRYWQLRINGHFVKVMALDTAMQMALHDELFYQMAMEDEIELTEEEREYLENDVSDFWYDLTERGGDERLGIEREDIYHSMEKMAYAQKYQEIYANLQNEEYSSYEHSSETYVLLLEEQDYTIKESVWNRVDMGNITINY